MMPARHSLDPALTRELRELLLEARSRLLKTVATTEAELATLETHQPGAPVEDAAREEVLRILSRLGARKTLELEDIYAAYARLEAGTLGTCDACGEPIPAARLRAVPTARYCLRCQATRERATA